MTAIPAPTRTRIVSAAHALVREHGYAGASVAAVADRAGTGASTLYRHFPSKAGLFVEVFRSVCEGEMAAAEAAAQQAANPLDQLYAWMQTFCARALAAPSLAWALIAEPVDPLVEQERLVFRRAYRDRIADLITQAQAADLIPPQDPVLSAAALIGGMAEALVGPTAQGAIEALDADAVLKGVMAFVRRALGDAG
ncbi:MAG TPA: TetR/AcrR family transcriptional regulator [Euzebya sp.]|nr:TetR/AcrR family transcriptional regulator [Euzebya sp.]